MMGIGLQVARGGHDTGGAQHLSAGLTAGQPAVIAAASGRGTTAITKPAAGPAESRQNGGGADIHQRSRPPCAGDDVGRAPEKCSPDRSGRSGGRATYTWRGHRYVGVQAIAAAAGVHTRTVQWHMKRHGNLNFLGVGPGTGPNNCRMGGRRVPISLFGREWPSRAALAADMGVKYRSASRLILEGRLDLILSHLMRADAARMADTAKARAKEAV